MAITLNDETVEMVERRRQKSGFSSADDVVRAGLAALDEYDKLASFSDEEVEFLYPAFREKISEGIADAEAGRLTDGDVFFGELERDETATEIRPHNRGS